MGSGVAVSLCVAHTAPALLGFGCLGVSCTIHPSLKALELYFDTACHFAWLATAAARATGGFDITWGLKAVACSPERSFVKIIAAELRACGDVYAVVQFLPEAVQTHVVLAASSWP